MNEADEILDSDLQAAEEYYRKHTQGMHVHQQAERIAWETYGIRFTDTDINRCCEAYACSGSTIESIVEWRVKRYYNVKA